MSEAVLIDHRQAKPRKTPAHLRKPQILALQAAGMTQEQIAQHFGVSRSTITQDLQEIQPAREQCTQALSDLVSAIETLHSTEDAAVNYVELATSAKNEAVRLGAQQRIDDLRGIVTQKELIRAKSHEPAAPQPMFVLPPGANLSFTFNAAQPASDAARDVTPHEPATSDKTEE